MGRISRRAASIGESATLAIEARTKELVAAGEDVISFAAGEPDFATPAHVVEAAQQACADPRNHHYTPTAGLPELREALAAKTARDSGLHVSPNQVLVTNGGKQAVAHAFAVLLDPGDEVIVPAPYWVTYPEAIELAGGVCAPVATSATAGFRVTVQQLEAARTSRTKALLFVSPSNPTGAVYSRAEIEAIGAWALEHHLWVVTDEIYEHLVYGTAQFHSMPALVPELASRCIVVNGVAKTYAMTGWRVGWLIGPPDVTRAAINIQSHTTSHVANVSQRAALAAIAGGLDDVARMRRVFDRRRVQMQQGLAAIAGVRCSEPQGAFYAFPSMEAYLSPPGAAEDGAAASSSALAGALLEEARVAVVPGEAFGAPGHFRLSYALDDQLLDTGLQRLAEFLASRSPRLPDEP